MANFLTSQGWLRPAFSLTYLAANIGLVLYGALTLTRPGILLEPFLLNIYRFPQEATRATGYLAALFRLLGYFNILPGMIGLLLLGRMRISGEKWIIRIVIITTACAYLGPIVFDNTVGRIGFFEIIEHVLFGLVLLLGILAWRDWAIGATRVGVWAIKHVWAPLQRWIYRLTGGRVLSTLGSGRHVLLLTTRGRRTGKERTTPVFYLRDGESIILCNVNHGFERTNPWVLNLRTHPIAQLQIGRETGHYQARQATEVEIERYWPRLVVIWPAYQTHYERGGRRSIFILERV